MAETATAQKLSFQGPQIASSPLAGSLLRNTPAGFLPFLGSALGSVPVRCHRVQGGETTRWGAAGPSGESRWASTHIFPKGFCLSSAGFCQFPLQTRPRRVQISDTNAELLGCPMPREHRALSGRQVGGQRSCRDQPVVWSIQGYWRESCGLPADWSL